MPRQLFLTTVIVLVSSLAALAQATDPGAVPDGEGAPPAGPELSRALEEAFFENAAAGMLRPQDEIRRNWDALAEEEKEEMKTACAGVSDEDAIDTAPDDTTTGTSDEEADPETRAKGGMTIAIGAREAAMARLCSYLETL